MLTKNLAMAEIRIDSIKVKNYRSFCEQQYFEFPDRDYRKPVAIVGYNNCGKTNLMNLILYGLGEKYVSRDTFCLDDFHNRKIENIPSFSLSVTSSIEKKYDGKEANMTGDHRLIVQVDGEVIEGSTVECYLDGRKNYQSFGAIKYFNVFYINFHNIKDEICTKKTNWGNLKSFLAKHIKYLVDNDPKMAEKKVTFEEKTKEAVFKVLEDSRLSEFIESIRKNYSANLKDNNCEAEFGLPHYDNIFLQMMFKVGLSCEDGNAERLPISHFGDGYVSMFVMAVIQAIAETDSSDKCLFLFEEPESFLHENHQDYFYQMVLCSLADKGHQVIYTTHSDKMVDIFDTKGIIRLEFDEVKKQTVKKFNNTGRFSPKFNLSSDNFPEVITLETYNGFIKSIEPNLNKILFSRKVLLVEGPNDLMAYKYAVEKKVRSVVDNRRYAQTYLSYLNMPVITHHGKGTALLLIEVCKHLHVDYFVISDWDFDDDFVSELAEIENIPTLKESSLYLLDKGKDRSPQSKSMITMNWQLINRAGVGKIHFNIRKLESVLGYNSNDKNSVAIWKKLNEIESFSESFFPPCLEQFLEFDLIKQRHNVMADIKIEGELIEQADYFPF
jgi:putative ATP-dependent endonuclease of the OLD family